MKPGSYVAMGGVILGVLFALFAGEYSVFDWLAMRDRVRAERTAIAQLRTETDSLSALADALERDSSTQEREARERFGMIRDGEIMFRISADQQDTTGR